MSDLSSSSISLDDVNKRLSGLKDKLHDLSQPLNEIGQYLLASTDIGFEREMNPYGIPWKPNAPFILQMKRRKGLILKVLQATGRLRGSISYRVNNEELMIGTNVDYAYKHQLGIDVPKREFLGISEQNLADITEILDSYFSENLR